MRLMDVSCIMYRRWVCLIDTIITVRDCDDGVLLCSQSHSMLKINVCTTRMVTCCDKYHTDNDFHKHVSLHDTIITVRDCDDDVLLCTQSHSMLKINVCTTRMVTCRDKYHTDNDFHKHVTIITVRDYDGVLLCSQSHSMLKIHVCTTRMVTCRDKYHTDNDFHKHVTIITVRDYDDGVLLCSQSHSMLKIHVCTTRMVTCRDKYHTDNDFHKHVSLHDTIITVRDYDDGVLLCSQSHSMLKINVCTTRMVTCRDKYHTDNDFHKHVSLHDTIITVRDYDDGVLLCSQSHSMLKINVCTTRMVTCRDKYHTDNDFHKHVSLHDTIITVRDYDDGVLLCTQSHSVLKINVCTTRMVTCRDKYHTDNDFHKHVSLHDTIITVRDYDDGVLLCTQSHSVLKINVCTTRMVTCCDKYHTDNDFHKHVSLHDTIITVRDYDDGVLLCTQSHSVLKINVCTTRLVTCCVKYHTDNDFHKHVSLHDTIITVRDYDDGVLLCTQSHSMLKINVCTTRMVTCRDKYHTDNDFHKHVSLHDTIITVRDYDDGVLLCTQSHSVLKINVCTTRLATCCVKYHTDNDFHKHVSLHDTIITVRDYDDGVLLCTQSHSVLKINVCTTRLVTCYDKYHTDNDFHKHVSLHDTIITVRDYDDGVLLCSQSHSMLKINVCTTRMVTCCVKYHTDNDILWQFRKTVTLL